MATKLFPGAARTGVATTFDVVTTPNCPSPVTPQHHMALAASSPHACSWPSVRVVNTCPPAMARGPLPKLDPVDPLGSCTPTRAPASVTAGPLRVGDTVVREVADCVNRVLIRATGDFPEDVIRLRHPSGLRKRGSIVEHGRTGGCRWRNASGRLCRRDGDRIGKRLLESLRPVELVHDCTTRRGLDLGVDDVQPRDLFEAAV